MTDFDTILYEKDGPVATLTLNRPDRMNAMTNRMVLETGRALVAAAEDPELRVLVLTGSGRSFCPGADLQGVASGSINEDRLRPEDFRVPVQLHNLPAVTIAAVNGACAGAGLGWALACDLRDRRPVGPVQHRLPRRRGGRRHGRAVEPRPPGGPGQGPRALLPAREVRRRRGAAHRDGQPGGRRRAVP